MTPKTGGRVETGVRGLDEVLRGGLPRDHLYLLQGPSGSGKTTLALQFLMEGARRGERSLYIGTAETEAEIEAVAESHGWDLTGVEVRHHGGPRQPMRGPEQTMLLPHEAELPRVMDKIMTVVDEVEPSLLVLDSLNEIRLLAREANWFRDQIKVLQEHLASGRCTVLLTDLAVMEQPALRSAVHGVIELEQHASTYGPDRRRLRVVKMRGVSHVTGYHDLAINTGGIEIFPRLIAAEHRRERTIETVSTGLTELDTLLGGGIDRGTATLLLGPTGTGKSTLMTQHIVAAARRGEKSVMYVFDERIETLFGRSASLGLELREHFERGTVIVRQVDPVELTPGQFSRSVLRAVEEGVQTVAIDSLNGYAYAMPGERLLELHLHELTSYLSQQGVTSLLVMTEHGLFTPQPRDFDVSYIADTVIVLRPFEFRGEVRNAIAVHKRRLGAHERYVREFDLSRDKVTVGPPLDDFAGIIAGRLQYFGDRPARS